MNTMREVSIEGCKVLGEGANGTVYQLAPDTMIKVFKHNVSLDAIETEREASKRAFLLGVPCAIAFDTVKCGDCYGTVYEMLNAATLSERITAEPARLPELAKSSALLLKQLHEINVPDGKMRRASLSLHNTIDKLTGDFTPEEITKMHALYDAIPEANHFIHNDYHAKNIMESNGELMLIDLGDAGMGNPAIDIIHTCMIFTVVANGMEEKSDDVVHPFTGLTFRQMHEFWDIFIDTYCNGNQEKIKTLQKRLDLYANFMHISLAMSHPLMPKEYRKVYAEKLRTEIFPRYDEMMSYKWEESPES